MGSRGDGSFGNYQPKDDQTKCGEDIGAVSLEDVTLYDKNNGELPKVDELIRVEFHDESKRLVAISDLTNEIIGAIPTRFNFMLICIKNNYNYAGKVFAMINHPLPRVEVEINAI